MTTNDDPESRQTAEPTSNDVADQLPKLERRRPFQWGLVAGVLVAVAIVLLVVQNSHDVAVEWLWLDFEAAQWAVLVVTFVAGMIVAEAGRLLIRWARGRAATRRKLLETAGRRLRRS